MSGLIETTDPVPAGVPFVKRKPWGWYVVRRHPIGRFYLFWSGVAWVSNLADALYYQQEWRAKEEAEELSQEDADARGAHS